MTLKETQTQTELELLHAISGCVESIRHIMYWSDKKEKQGNLSSSERDLLSSMEVDISQLIDARNLIYKVWHRNYDTLAAKKTQWVKD